MYNARGCPIPLRDRAQYLNIVAGGAEPALPYLLGREFRVAADERPYRLIGQDAHDYCDSLLLSPDGRYLLYGVARGTWPALELLDLSTGARSLFRVHACDPAWGEDDEIAYVHYLSFNPSFVGDRSRLVVQHGLAGAPAAWSRVAAWGDPIWAGEDLLAYKAAADGERALVIYYRPRQDRNVDPHARRLDGPVSTVVAVNPQGTEALLDTQRPGPGGGGPGADDLATLVRISDAKVLSTARIGTGGFYALAADGSWQGDKVITTLGVFMGGPAHPGAGVITLTVTGDRVRLRSTKPFLDHGYKLEGDDPQDASQARFLDPTGRHVAVWFRSAFQLEYLACDTLTQRCTQSRNYDHLDTAPGRGVAFVASPSRP